MSDGSLFDVFIQGASNGGTLTEASKWLPCLFQQHSGLQKLGEFIFFKPLSVPHRRDTGNENNGSRI